MSFLIILGLCTLRLKALIFLIAVPLVLISVFLLHLTYRKAKIVRFAYIVQLCSVPIEEELLLFLCFEVW